MLSGLEKSSKSRTTKEANLAKNSKTPTFSPLKKGQMVSSAKRHGLGYAGPRRRPFPPRRSCWP